MISKNEHWEHIYADRSPTEVSWYQQQPTLSLKFITNAGLAQDAFILDVGGGASVLVDRLAEQGYHNLAVLDISARALAHSKERLGMKATAMEWYEADITEFEAPHPFSLWHDRAVFHFLTSPRDRRKYVEVLHHTLEKGGHIILAAFAIGGPTRCSGLDIVQYDAEKLHRELGACFHLMETQEEIHLTPTMNEQKFAFFRFVKTC